MMFDKLVPVAIGPNFSGVLSAKPPQSTETLSGFHAERKRSEGRSDDAFVRRHFGGLRYAGSLRHVSGSASTKALLLTSAAKHLN